MTLDTPVRVKSCGNITEIRYVFNSPHEIPIEKLNADYYLDKRTGEVKEIRHRTNRAEDKASVAQSLCKLRDIINANLEKPENALWVTLTYAENMTDTVQLYEDYRRFWGRFQYYMKKIGQESVEYIIAAEPQQRGAWHLHCLFMFPYKAPFISNDDMARIWGNGFTKTKSLRGISNPGLYLTAYLGDMELTEAVKAGTFSAQKLSESKDKSKAVIKGARLRLYPAGFNLYRCSRGVKRPQIWKATEGEAQTLVEGAELTYEKTIAITNELGETLNVINYRNYQRIKAGE